jgi:hypothetical protein
MVLAAEQARLPDAASRERTSGQDVSVRYW